MDEPTLAEEVRRLGDHVRRLVEVQQTYVTKEIMDLKLDSLAKDQAEDRARLDAMSRWLWSGVVAPVIVGIILYVLLGKGP
jgi:cytochrome c-type biogenesis protein CcmH/NrfG